MKKFTILTFALLLAACAVGPPYPNDRERRAETYYENDGYRCYYDPANYPHYDTYHNSYYDNNGYRCYYYDAVAVTPAQHYDYYGRPVDGHYYYDRDDRNWDGSHRYYNRSN